MENPPIHFVKIPFSQLPKLKNEPKFILIMRLCRLMNQLTFCHKAYLDYANNTTPDGIRQTHNALMFSCAVLYESFKLVEDLGKEFRTFSAFKKGFGTFLKDREVSFLREKVLNKLRNGTIYHVDAKPIEETLQTLNIRKLRLFTATNNTTGDMYFQLADDIALNYLIGDLGTPEAEAQYLTEVLNKIASITVKFVTNAQNLIGEYGKRKCWKVEIE